MNKYISILVAVMLATFSLTLTSCGDDDDNELDGGNGINTLIINGIKYFDDCPSYNNLRSNEYTFNYYPASTDENAELNAVYNHLEISIHQALSSGMNIPFDDIYSFSIAISTEYRYHDFSGNIKVISVSDNAITLSFENCKCTSTRNDDWDITINGTATFENFNQ